MYSDDSENRYASKFKDIKYHYYTVYYYVVSMYHLTNGVSSVFEVRLCSLISESVGVVDDDVDVVCSVLAVVLIWMLKWCS